MALLDIHEPKIMSNRLTIVRVPLEGANTTSIYCYDKTGSRYDPITKAGLWHVLEHLMFKGTAHMPDWRKVMEFLRPFPTYEDSQGAETTREHMCFYLEYPTTSDVWNPIRDEFSTRTINRIKKRFWNIERVFWWLGEVMLRPLIAAPNLSDDQAKEMDVQMQRELKVIMEELRWFEDDPWAITQESIWEMAYRGHAIAPSIIGTPESLAQIKREDLIQAFEKGCRPEDLVLVVVGRTPEGPIDTAALKHFSVPTERRGAAYTKIKPQPRVGLPLDERVAFIPYVSRKCYMSIGFPTGGLSDDYSDVIPILQRLISERGASWLPIEMREKRGMGYRMPAEHESYSDCGMLTITMHIIPERIIDALEVVFDVLHKARTATITQVELTDAKFSIFADLASATQSPHFAAHYIYQEIVKNEGKTPDQMIRPISHYQRGIAKVSDRMRLEAANAIFKKDKLFATFVGPGAEFWTDAKKAEVKEVLRKNLEKLA